MWIAISAFGLVLLAAGLFFLLAGERGRFRRSTWQFFRESGFRLSTLHGYVYGRWTRQYIGALLRLPPPTGNPRAVKTGQWLADHYHGKVLTPEHARAILNCDRKISLRDLEQIVPYPAARNLVLNGPPDLVAYECVCRHSRKEHCEPTQVCLVVGKPMSDFVAEHHPETARRITREEGLALLEAEHRRGHLHSAWFKDALMNRFYAICNCCKCCCGGVRMMQQGLKMLASSGYVAQLNRELCAVCGDCVSVCAFSAIAQDDDGIRHDWERCMGCGACQGVCATGAVSLVRDERKGIPLDVRALA
jgi:ferredoxin